MLCRQSSKKGKVTSLCKWKNAHLIDPGDDDDDTADFTDTRLARGLLSSLPPTSAK